MTTETSTESTPLRPETIPNTLTTQLQAVLDGRWAQTRDVVRRQIDEQTLVPQHGLSLADYRERVLDQMKQMVPLGFPAAGFRPEHGGTGDVGAAVTAIVLSIALLAANLDRQEEFRAGVERAIEYARVLQPEHINLLAGASDTSAQSIVAVHLPDGATHTRIASFASDQGVAVSRSVGLMTGAPAEASTVILEDLAVQAA